jgi:hypothetical protein
VELEGPRGGNPSRGSLKLAAISYVFTLARVAAILDVDEDLLHEIVIDMEPEDGVIAVYGTADEYTPAFTSLGIENLKELIPLYPNKPPPIKTPRP